MPNQIRDLYYQLFNTLSASRKKNQLETELHEKQDLIVDTLNNAFTYEELHKALKEKTAQYFEDAKKFPAGKFHDLYDQGLYQPELYERYTFRKRYQQPCIPFRILCMHFFSKSRDRTDSQSISDRIPNGKGQAAAFRSQIQDFRDFFQGRLYGWQLLRKKLQKYSGFSPSEYREKMS